MEWKNMNYTCWINADDEEIDICEMDNEYIKNCIQCIQKSDYKHFTREDAMKDKEQKIFGPWWCYEHAQNYLASDMERADRAVTFTLAADRAMARSMVRPSRSLADSSRAVL